MTLKLEIPAEVEAGLLAQAQANGLSLEAYVKQVLGERSRAVSPPRKRGRKSLGSGFVSCARASRSVTSRLRNSLTKAVSEGIRP